MSIYKGELDPIYMARGIKKIQNAFPSLTGAFFEVLTDRLEKNSYCNTRLRDAINHVIDNCIYPTPTIAQFITFDKKYKLYDYNQFLKLNDDLSGRASKLYKPVRIGGGKRPAYVHVNDIKKYNIEPWH